MSKLDLRMHETKTGWFIFETGEEPLGPYETKHDADLVAAILNEMNDKGRLLVRPADVLQTLTVHSPDKGIKS
jgi:hypothetical protein